MCLFCLFSLQNLILKRVRLPQAIRIGTLLFVELRLPSMVEQQPVQMMNLSVPVMQGLQLCPARLSV